MAIQNDKSIIRPFERFHHCSVLIVMISILGWGCGKKSGGGGTPAGDQGPSGPDPASVNTQSSGTTQAGGLKLDFDLAAQSFASGVTGGEYSVKGQPLPSLEKAFNAGLPAGMKTGSLLLSTSLNLVPLAPESQSADDEALHLQSQNTTCELLPPHQNLRAVTNTTIRDALLGSCRAKVGGSDVAASLCDSQIVSGKDEWVNGSNITYTYQNGFWDRFFDGCGPTDIRVALKSIDTDVIADINRLTDNGSFRCVEIPGLHKEFGSKVEGAGFSSSLLDQSTYPFACTSKVDANYRAYGKKDGFFYYWDTATNGSIVKVSTDGLKIDLLKSIGTVTGVEATDISAGSLGLYRLKSEKTTSGDSSFHFTAMGQGIGPNCGVYIASKKTAATDLMFIEMRFDSPGSASTTWAQWKTRCDSGSTVTLCFKNDFTPAQGADPTVTTLCAAAGLTTPPAGFKKFAYDSLASGSSKTFISPADVAVAIKSVVQADKLTFASLVETSKVKDPLKNLVDRMFGTTVAADYDVASLVDAGNKGSKDVLALIKEKNPQCVYEVPSAFNHQGALVLEPESQLLLSCKSGSRYYGVSGDQVYFYDAQENGQRIAARLMDGALSVWRYKGKQGVTAQEWANSDGVGSYMRVNIRTDGDQNTLQEVLLFGDDSTYSDLGCGIHFRRNNQLYFVRGKFGSTDCGSRIMDTDCLERDPATGKFTRVALKLCRDGQEKADPFEIPSQLREDIVPGAFAGLGFLPGPVEGQGVLSVDTPRSDKTPAAVSAAPSTALALKAVTSLPTVTKTKSFKKVAVDSSNLGINCLFAGSGNVQKTLTGKFRYEFKDLSAADLESVNKSIATRDFYVATDIKRIAVQVVGTVATPTIKADLQITLFDGETKLRSLESKDHTSTGLHVVSGFDDLTLGASHSLEVAWTGLAEVLCPSDKNSQAMAGFNLNSAPKIRFR